MPLPTKGTMRLAQAMCGALTETGLGGALQEELAAMGCGL